MFPYVFVKNFTIIKRYWRNCRMSDELKYQFIFSIAMFVMATWRQYLWFHRCELAHFGWDETVIIHAAFWSHQSFPSYGGDIFLSPSIWPVSFYKVDRRFDCSRLSSATASRRNRYRRWMRWLVLVSVCPEKKFLHLRWSINIVYGRLNRQHRYFLNHICVGSLRKSTID